MIRQILTKPGRLIQRLRYRPDLPVKSHKLKTLRLGSSYGGWTFVDHDELRGSTIVSAGLGEDASFDIAFANRYDAAVVFVDPTPRAIRHYESIIASLGQPRTTEYSATGLQETSSYELSELNQERLKLVDSALWFEETDLKFFTPVDPSHVSHSIGNFQNDYAESGDHITVKSQTLDRILKDLNLSDIALLKLDIEGAEIEVLPSIVQAGVRPRQILVEFDELAKPSRISMNRINGAHSCLIDSGYELIHHDKPANFLYILAE